MDEQILAILQKNKVLDAKTVGLVKDLLGRGKTWEQAVVGGRYANDVAFAKAKAEAMAKGAGVKVGRVVEISDASAPVPVFRANTRMMAMSAESAAPQIEPGSLEVEGSCVLTAEITQ